MRENFRAALGFFHTEVSKDEFTVFELKKNVSWIYLIGIK